MVLAIEASLRRLRTDTIDLYWMHIWDQITPVEEVMRAFDDLVRQGKVLYAGVSDAPAWWVARANTFAELRGWTPFVGLQIEYSLVERTVERELVPMAEALGVGVTAWSPLGGGVLTGKYAAKSGGGRFDNAGMKQFQAGGERVARIVSELRTIAQEVDRSAAQVALKWLMQRPIPVIPIVGARRLEQFRDNLACLDLRLTDEQIHRLDAASTLELGFPHDFYANEMVRSMVYGGMRERIVFASNRQV